MRDSAVSGVAGSASGRRGRGGEEVDGEAAGGDLAALREIAHDMSGTCGCFGALRLGELAWELELMCRAGDVPRARALVRTMVPVTAATRAALRRRYFCH